uniref:Cytochrome P450 n=1 Tax=Salix viminalis TaxID=40686 RepID=A0A6N2MD92_SALVM
MDSTPPKSKIRPPSPKTIPILGNLHQLGSHPHRKLHSLAKCYGSLMMLHFGSKPVLMVSSADAAQEILKTHDLIFSNRPKLSVSDKLLYQGKDISTSPYGEYWRWSDQRACVSKTGGSVHGEDQQDFVDVLLELQKDNLTGFPIARVTVKALILEMFAAGTDTTHTVLEWAMAELLRHPGVMKQVQNEVRGLAGAGKLEITENDSEKMHYLRAATPPIPLLIPREASQDVKINGYDIAAGTMVMINAWAIGRDPATWDQPEEYRPERFLNSSVDFRGEVAQEFHEEDKKNSNIPQQHNWRSYFQSKNVQRNTTELKLTSNDHLAGIDQ